jgi:cyclohexa-1,5-dienecarbonyl-CoA hydratase
MVMNSSQRVTLLLEAPVSRIALARPPLNIFDFQMMDEFLAALKSVQERSEVCALVLSGSERAFSAGVDVAVHTLELVPAMLEKFHSLILAVTRLNKITIAEVQGVCLGGGAELAMVCDMCFTTADAKWGFPEITLGCYPPVACTALAALIGEKRAADLIFTGRVISGREAADWGLANQACSQDELSQTVQDRLSALVKLSPTALAHAKKAFYAWDSVHLDKGLARAEKVYNEELMKTEDAKEGVAAWMEKRKPKWKGK